jgi:hypothetical protein
MEQDPLRIGVTEGRGQPPGYQWHVWLIGFVCEETLKLVGDLGYAHLRDQVQQLAREQEPSRSDIVDVRPVEDFFEIRDKGAPFGGANIRLFFGLDHEARVIIPLGTIKKQNNGPTPQGDKVRMRRRWQAYRRGEFPPPTV